MTSGCVKLMYSTGQWLGLMEDRTLAETFYPHLMGISNMEEADRDWFLT